MPRVRRQPRSATYTTDHIFELSMGSRWGFHKGFPEDWDERMAAMLVAWPLLRDRVFTHSAEWNAGCQYVACIHRQARIRPCGWYLLECPHAAITRSTPDRARAMADQLLTLREPPGLSYKDAAQWRRENPAKKWGRVFDVSHLDDCPGDYLGEFEYLRHVGELTGAEIARGELHLDPPAGTAPSTEEYA